jgi:hypothetical protein
MIIQLEKEMLEYRTDKEARYFASDINKFASLVCGKDQTIMNIDMIQYKRDLNIIRFIEYKHDNELMSNSQFEFYQKLAICLKEINDPICEVISLRSDPPFQNTKFYNFVSGEYKVINQDQLINYLNFK